MNFRAGSAHKQGSRVLGPGPECALGRCARMLCKYEDVSEHMIFIKMTLTLHFPVLSSCRIHAMRTMMDFLHNQEECTGAIDVPSMETGKKGFRSFGASIPSN